MVKKAKIWINILLVLNLVLLSLPANVSADTVLDETTRLKSLEYASYQVFSNGKTEWTVKIQSDEPIDVRMLDEDNYNKFTNDESYEAYSAGSADDVVSKTYKVTLPGGAYYVVLDNSENIFPTDVTIKITAEDPKETEESDDSPGFEFITVISAIVISLVILNLRKKKQ